MCRIWTLLLLFVFPFSFILRKSEKRGVAEEKNGWEWR